MLQRLLSWSAILDTWAASGSPESIMHHTDTRRPPADKKLRELASWYRECAERAGSTTIWRPGCAWLKTSKWKPTKWRRFENQARTADSLEWPRFQVALSGSRIDTRPAAEVVGADGLGRCLPAAVPRAAGPAGLGMGPGSARDGAGAHVGRSPTLYDGSVGKQYGGFLCPRES
jgi:hypothetical protein